MNIDDLDFDDLEILEEIKEELVEEKVDKRQALRNKIRAKRQMRQGNVENCNTDSPEDLASMLDQPGMSEMVNKLLKGNNLDLLQKCMSEGNSSKKAKTIANLINK